MANQINVKNKIENFNKSISVSEEDQEERTAADGSGGESSLYSIDLTGYNERKIITPLGSSDPAWSPLMH